MNITGISLSMHLVHKNVSFFNFKKHVVSFPPFFLGLTYFRGEYYHSNYLVLFSSRVCLFGSKFQLALISFCLAYYSQIWLVVFSSDAFAIATLLGNNAPFKESCEEHRWLYALRELFFTNTIMVYK